MSFLIGDTILLEAGSAASGLSMEEQGRIEHVLVTHAHLDHVKDLAFLAENAFLQGERQFRVHGTAECMRDLRTHLFNDALWPDFTRLPSPEHPTVLLESLPESGRLLLEGLQVLAVPVDHPGGSVGFLLQSSESTLVYSGDTGNTVELWDQVRAAGNLSGLIVETSFPNELEDVAELSGHLTPARLAEALARGGIGEVPVYASSIKTPGRRRVLEQLEALGDPRIRILEPGMVLEF